MDIFHFHMINERFGTAYGDDVLRRIGNRVREVVQDTGGIVCRREADTFMVYCPHGKDYRKILENASVGLTGDNSVNNRVRLRMGVYANVDKTLDIERRFDRAGMAADTIRGNFSNNIGIYDSSLHEKELYVEQLIEDFHEAIEKEQFAVFYQPKFDIRPEVPVLSSAEALVRWIHPELGMISPGVFIPLFEENGLIPTLDNYVWRHAAAQISDWKKRFGITVPVSVNVSRVDMYDPDMIDRFVEILKDNDLGARDLILEITESAYTQDSEQIIETVNKLRELGFRIEMDDFGTGYSSLNMISELPIDALKLDMQFIRSAFSQKKDTKLLEVIIDIADYLSVPVIAEGVETEEQLNALKAMGCDIVQGYYFSKPLPSGEYEGFIIEHKNMILDVEEDIGKFSRNGTERSSVAFGKVAHALSNGFDNIFYIDTDSDHYVEFNSEGRDEDLQIRRSGSNFFNAVADNIKKSVFPDDQDKMMAAMNKEWLLKTLTDAPFFSVLYRVLISGHPVFFNLKAVKVNTHDDHHIVIGISNVNEQMEQAGGPGIHRALSFSSIAQALSQDYFSIYYVDTETNKFVEYSSHKDYSQLNIETEGDDFFEQSRTNIKRVIHQDDVEMFLDVFTKENVLSELEKNGIFTLTYRLIFGNTPRYVHMKVTGMENKNDKHIVIGVSDIDEQIRREQEYSKAMFLANRDALTGVKSKHAYNSAENKIDAAIAAGEQEPFALAVCDINGLKQINDSLGHQAGDDYIKEACKTVCNVFKHSPVYRIGGDEFAVILTGSDYEIRNTLRSMMGERNREGGVVIACGMADFVPGDDSVAGVFSRADTAMYDDKKKLKDQIGA